MTDSAIEVCDFVVRRDDWTKSEFFTRTIDPPRDGEVLFRIDRYALTSNNISYAVSGDALGYWKFFPTKEGYGRLPCFAFADVQASAHPDVKEGDRYFGYFPMSSHLRITADRVKAASLVDGSEHRKQLPAAYNRYANTAHDPAYQQKYEDAQMLVQPLFMTSWLVDDFLGENGIFGARSVIVTSASSKTSIALAFRLKQRGDVQVLGLTSKRNARFVDDLDLYDNVLTYDDIASFDASEPVAIVDMAGDREVIGRLHRHFGGNLKYNCVIGATHWDRGGRDKDLPGAKPQFFFAPAQIKKRSEEWGRMGLMQRIGESWVPFVRTTDDWLKVVRQEGKDAIAATYADVVAGRSKANEGQILSFC